ncbi:hypothetical protein GOZ96_04735 [Agrobacterium vitis]|uniref:Uncharacterized protein n=1 Tax=Agrobacterium vitis TaxID=373 RepID=A0A7J4X4P0_AGRVI|nr:hypothetical protein [Agrobacterium vitis]KAA3527050.1 hypothetical protein DXT89_14035 [Agrobacterium vitis]MUZ95895.1 hypothetical protein [Agrobacterium vitis]
MQQITQGRLKLAEYARSIHVAVAPHGVTLTDAMVPSFWAHVAAGIKAWDKIELRAEDDTWFAELMVVKANRLEVFVKVLSSFETTQAPAASSKKIDDVPPGYEVNYGGPIHKHRVIRTADSECLAHGLSKDDAIKWAKDHYTSINAA